MKNYKITIENGVTIINTGDAIGGLKNTSGHVGVGYLKDANKYTAKIFVGKRYHHLGRYDNIEDAIAIRQEAERHREDGTLQDWLAALPFKQRKGRPKSK